MHQFSDLISNVVEITLRDISERSQAISLGLQTSSSTSLIIGLKTIQMQRTVLLTGILSMFEAELQKVFPSKSPFKECGIFLQEIEKNDLAIQLESFKEAINVLKHGKGRSYDSLFI
ncbi:hypothetical protein [Algoriphagus formosus]|uniref:hypothetical protein n=1 Tax=Algoriphagus formosus TaxID=2007308 RepID=UPI003F72460B